MLFFLSVLVLVVSANAKFYMDCGSELATVHKVSVSDCADDAEKCVLKRGTNVTFSIDFTPNKEVQQVGTSVTADVLGFPVPLQVPQPDACKNSGLSCPLPAGQLTSLQTTIPIELFYQQNNMDTTWQLQDEHRSNFFCITIFAKVK